MLENVSLLLQEHTVFFLCLIGAWGLCMGSFLNVVIYRLPIMLEQQWAGVEVSDNTFNLWLPGSHCPLCQKHINAIHNIPILSFVILKGKSACCQQRIAWRYPFVEALTAVLSIVVALRFGFTWQCLAALGFTWALIALLCIDLKHKILPDTLTLPLLWGGLLVNTAQLFTTPENALYGAAIGYGLFWSIAILYQRFRHIEGLGQGDVKLLAACSAWVGWQMLPFIILFSSLSGIVVGSLYLLILKRGMRDPIPFGPFIAIAAFLALIIGPDILTFFFDLSQVV